MNFTRLYCCGTPGEGCALSPRSRSRSRSNRRRRRLRFRFAWRCCGWVSLALASPPLRFAPGRACWVRVFGFGFGVTSAALCAGVRLLDACLGACWAAPAPR